MSQWQPLPPGLRGIYALHKYDLTSGRYNVVYVGMAAGNRGIRSRLARHSRSKKKRSNWTHFSIFAVWENIRNDEIGELEALFREIYRKDGVANSLNKQRGSKLLRSIRQQNLKKW